MQKYFHSLTIASKHILAAVKVAGTVATAYNLAQSKKQSATLIKKKHFPLRGGVVRRLQSGRRILASRRAHWSHTWHSYKAKKS
jgi:hypothetical protein